jgi:hypothetical protein
MCAKRNIILVKVPTAVQMAVAAAEILRDGNCIHSFDIESKIETPFKYRAHAQCIHVETLM